MLFQNAKLRSVGQGEHNEDTILAWISSGSTTEQALNLYHTIHYTASKC